MKLIFLAFFAGAVTGAAAWEWLCRFLNGEGVELPISYAIEEEIKRNRRAQEERRRS